MRRRLHLRWSSHTLGAGTGSLAVDRLLSATVEVPAARWEGRDGEELARLWGATAVHLFSAVGSTNDVARRLAVDGAPAGTVVISELQTAGKGRAGRSWHSPAGAGLWFSLLLRPASGESTGSVPLTAAVQTARCLDPLVAPSIVGIKWPNDLQVQGRKLGGILCEGVWKGAAPLSLIAGIGLNLRQRRDDFPMDVRDGATSVLLESGCEPERLALATSLIPTLLRRFDQPLKLLPDELGELESRNVLHGMQVTVSEPASGATLGGGTVMGVAPDGALLVREGAGSLRRIHSGTVRPS